jgi:APA family basic amino acid/polyamine antiporter
MMTTTPVRPFGFWTATALVVGGMIGSGIFVLPSQLAPYGWTGVAAWVAGIAGTVLLAWVLALLAIAMPEAPGGIAITGRVLGPLPGVLIGWSYWVGIWSANAIIALTAVRYLAVFLPFLAPAFPQALGAVVVVWALTLLNLRGARAAGRFQVVTTILKVLPLVLVVLIILALWTGMIASPGDPGPHAAFSGSGVTPALAAAFFALVGFECASVAAERVDRPEVNVARATLAGGILTGLLYIVVCSGIIFALPEGVVRNAPAPISMFVGIFLGRGAELAIAGFAVIAATGALNGWILVQGEVPLGMARADLLPRWIGRTNDRDVPTGILLFTSLCTTALIMLSAGGTKGIGDFIDLTAAATVWLYIGACVAALRLGVARIPAILGLAFCGWVLVSTGLAANEVCLALMVSAVPLYLLRTRALAEQPA